MNTAVERAIGFIWEHYSEPLTLADIAGSATLSRFHLSRVFRAATSVTPCRFLSAVRIYQAKHMLLTSGASVTDISFAVGYNSVGSFTNYFTGSVGVSPAVFRQKAQSGDLEFPGQAHDTPDPSPGRGAVHGTIQLPAGYPGARVYLGAFRTAVVQHQPADAVVVDVPAGGRPCRYYLRGVPAGQWFVHAVGAAGPREIALVGGRGPVPVAARTASCAPVALRPRRATDPPVLLALPDRLAAFPASQTRARGRASCTRS
jgi:AraC family transcriptional regulator